MVGDDVKVYFEIEGLIKKQALPNFIDPIVSAHVRVMMKIVEHHSQLRSFVVFGEKFCSPKRMWWHLPSLQCYCKQFK